MENQFSRTEMLIGREAVERLASCRVAVFGIGGVGGFCVEALARCGVGTLDIIDADVVCESNINRQIIALHSTVGKPKVEVEKARLEDINPDITVNAFRIFYSPETEGSFDFSQYDYIVDAIDTVTGKIALAVNAKKVGAPIISSMGTGNKLNPAGFEVADIYKTSVCPLARVMRRELKKRGIESLKVVYSKEEPFSPAQDENGGKPIPASVSFVPSVAGLIIASEVIKDLIK
jgi:tRNA A37 threonylcarbamoyladenosine dehydratase